MPANGPSFRGPAASGVSASRSLPASWNVKTGDAILWKTPIPGLAHSSPIVRGDRIFLTTAISSLGSATFKGGLTGEGTASADVSPHEFKLLSLDRKSGKILWAPTAFQGPPREQRHIKSTYANATPATDGQVIVAFFGSQGLYAYDSAGKQLWKRGLGRLNAGAYDAAWPGFRLHKKLLRKRQTSGPLGQHSVPAAKSEAACRKTGKSIQQLLNLLAA